MMYGLEYVHAGQTRIGSSARNGKRGSIVAVAVASRRASRGKRNESNQSRYAVQSPVTSASEQVRGLLGMQSKHSWGVKRYGWASECR